MSPPPQPPGRVETNRSAFPRRGVGQKSAKVEFTGGPMFSADPHGPSIDWRWNTQMSFGSGFPVPPARFEAMHRLRPSGDSIGQPSAAPVLTPGSGTASSHAPNDLPAAPAGTVNMRTVITVAAATARRRRAWETRDMRISGPPSAFVAQARLPARSARWNERYPHRGDDP